MKDKLGVIRKIDKLGRVVIPKEIRDRLHIEDNTDLSFMIRSDYITIKPIAEVKCCLCDNVVNPGDKYCSQCGHLL